MCGVIGIIGTESSQYNRAVQESYNGLLKLQHRGQDAAGMLFIDEQGAFRLHKQMGLISEVLSSAGFRVLRVRCALGILDMRQQDRTMPVIYNRWCLDSLSLSGWHTMGILSIITSWREIG